MKVVYPFLLTLLILASCDESRVYETNIDINNKIWLADSIIRHDFEIKDIKETYNLYVNIRNTVGYPYENIYLTYYLKDTANNELRKDLINFNLFDPKTGKPYGDGLGDLFDHQFMVLKDLSFDRPGPYVFELQQYMRMDSLPEIMSVGLRVEKNMAE